ncbi:UNVERIFIED_CONTAM: hypothetical protein Sradi_6998300 [Sesamum radiatum]|uniref:Uncharacterized protein n=1 Tax=Sesamum radiatum TaxID=300843 RepID=A0AAW2JCW3_SESRA
MQSSRVILLLLTKVSSMMVRGLALWMPDGCNQSQLGVVAELVNIKVDGHISERIYYRISQWANKILPSDHTLQGDYYITKKLVKDLGLPVEKINACKNGCMLYWKDDVDLEYCKFCGEGRYKPARGRDPHRKKSLYAVLRYLPLTARLQRLYSPRATVEHMAWHATHQIVEGSMCHPSDAEAWKHFDRMYPDFVEEPRNVWLGLCTDGLHRTISMVVLINVSRLSLHRTIFPLLWHVGVRTYDHATDRAFMMWVALMWTMNYLPAYGMGYSICMDDTTAFHLQHGRKACYFDCHRQFLLAHHPYRRNKNTFTENHVENKVARSRLTGDLILDQVANTSPAVEMPFLLPDGYGSDHKWAKKSIFWDLPYWSTLLIRHNFDIMHIEKNVFDNIFNTVMDIKGKTKDNMNSRRDLKIICNRPELELDEYRPKVMPKAVYTLGKEQKRRVREWIRGPKFPDGYASNLARCIDMMELWMHGIKSHDCHVFIQKFIPIAFHEMLPGHVWSALIEMIERYIKSRDPNWPDRVVPQPLADATAPTTTSIRLQMGMI